MKNTATVRTQDTKKEQKLSTEAEAIIKQIENNIDDYYPTLAEGCIVLIQRSNSSYQENIMETFECEQSVAEEILNSGLIEIEPYECTNPENDQNTLYLDVIHLKGAAVYFED